MGAWCMYVGIGSCFGIELGCTPHGACMSCRVAPHHPCPRSHLLHFHTHLFSNHRQVFAGYDGGSAYSKPTKEDLSKVVGRSME